MKLLFPAPVVPVPGSPCFRTLQTPLDPGELERLHAPSTHPKSNHLVDSGLTKTVDERGDIDAFVPDGVEQRDAYLLMCLVDAGCDALAGSRRRPQEADGIAG